MMRAPQVGDYVTIVAKIGDSTTFVAYVCNDPAQAAEARKRTGMPWVAVGMLHDEDRGVSWALGTEGEEVEALKVANMLC